LAAAAAARVQQKQLQKVQRAVKAAMQVRPASWRCASSCRCPHLCCCMQRSRLAPRHAASSSLLRPVCAVRCASAHSRQRAQASAAGACKAAACIWRCAVGAQCAVRIPCSAPQGSKRILQVRRLIMVLLRLRSYQTLLTKTLCHTCVLHSLEGPLSEVLLSRCSSAVHCIFSGQYSS
jgi:hypothetical protein